MQAELDTDYSYKCLDLVICVLVSYVLVTRVNPAKTAEQSRVYYTGIDQRKESPGPSRGTYGCLMVNTF